MSEAEQLTTPIRIHYENPQSPHQNEYDDGDYEENVEVAEDDAMETFDAATTETVELVQSLRQITEVSLVEEESYPGWPVTTLDFVTVVLDVMHDANEDGEAVRSAIEAVLEEDSEQTLIDVHIVQPELP